MTIRIVLADDSVLLREGISRLLSEAGLEGDTAPASAGQAVEAVVQGLRSSGRSYYP